MSNVRLMQCTNKEVTSKQTVAVLNLKLLLCQSTKVLTALGPITFSVVTLIITMYALCTVLFIWAKFLKLLKGSCVIKTRTYFSYYEGTPAGRNAVWHCNISKSANTRMTVFSKHRSLSVGLSAPHKHEGFSIFIINGTNKQKHMGTNDT